MGPRLTRVEERHPLCNGLCGGARAAWEGPQRPGRRPDGTKVLWCRCCNTELTPVEGTVNQPQNIMVGVEPTGQRLMRDTICRYDVWWLKGLKAVD